ncbi:MAG TPA: hypothetical protein VF796_08205, partial [Humisphaera sp.]
MTLQDDDDHAADEVDGDGEGDAVGGEPAAVRRQAAAAERLRYAGHYVGAARAAAEAARLAKRHRLLMPYARALFTASNLGDYTLDHRAAYDANLELIALIESPAHRAGVQADYPADQFEAWADEWTVPCYHLLAETIGAMRGMNSPGLHACVADGVAVARRTGSRYLSSFHELASRVHEAADDLDMALHFARRVSGPQRSSASALRRYVGAYCEASIHLVSGRLDEALE